MFLVSAAVDVIILGTVAILARRALRSVGFFGKARIDIREVEEVLPAGNDLFYFLFYFIFFLGFKK